MKVKNQINKKKKLAVANGKNERITRSKTKKNEAALCLKSVRVNLDRLSNGAIHKMVNGTNKATKTDSVDFNFSLKVNENHITCTSHPPSVVPLINKKNICISIRKTNDAAIEINTVSTTNRSPLSIHQHHPSTDYSLRPRLKKTDKSPLKISKPNRITTVSEIGVGIQKNKLWTACKKSVNKSMLHEGSVVFAKQAGYAPWPSSILSINKSRTSAVVKYYGFANFKGTVKFSEIVQVDANSKESIGALVQFTLKTKAIKDFEQFNRAVQEIQGSMSN